MTKRILAALLSALMLLSLATACNNNTGGTSSTSGGGDTQQTGKVDLSQKRDISITAGSQVFISDWDNNNMTDQIEKDLNCNITFNLLPAGDDGKAKLQLMINGGDKLDDLIFYGLDSALTYQYGSGGSFVAMNDYFANKDIMPNFNAIESEDDKTKMLGDVTSADGNIYAMPQWQPETWNLTPYRIWMNMKWLENLDLEVPTTSEELKDVLTAFATKDPNGNGVKDEIPVLTNYVDSGNYGCNIILALINMFEYTSGSMSGLTLSEDGKTVMAPQITEGWQEAMKYLNSLADAGAILPDGSFISGTDTTGFKGTLNYQGIGTEEAPEGKSINIVGMFTAGSNSGNFADSGIDENENYLEYQMMPVPEGPDGTAYSPYAAPTASTYWYVTSEAEDPDFCVMMGDWFYETKHSMWARYGLEEVDWTMDEQFCADWYEEHTKLIEDTGNEQTIDDYYSIVRLRADAIWGENTSAFWHNQQPRYASLDFFNHAVDWYDPETFVYYRGSYSRLAGISKEYYGDAHPEYSLPKLSYTDEEQASITETQVAFPDVITEWTMRFISGEKDPESNWQEYVDALNGIGLQEYVQTTQVAYERSSYYKANFA